MSNKLYIYKCLNKKVIVKLYLIMYNIYNNRIQFNTTSWVNETNELIDYNNSLITESNFTINQPTKIYQLLNTIIIENDDNPLYIKNPENLIKLGEIILKNSSKSQTS